MAVSPQHRPRVLIGSSREGAPYVRGLQEELAADGALEVETWWQDVFALGDITIDRLISATGAFDFVVLVLTPDDAITIRDVEGKTPRANVLVEAGMFLGALGRRRTFLVQQADVDLQLPSDFNGLTYGTFHGADRGSPRAAMGPAATAIRKGIDEICSDDPAFRLKATQGTWQGSLWSTWGSDKSTLPAPGELREQDARPIFVTVTYDDHGDLKMRQFVEDADSNVASYKVMGTPSGGWSLHAVYETRLAFEPTVGHQRYWGAMVLESDPAQPPAGNYFTQLTAGTLRLDAWSPTVHNSYDEAASDEYAPFQG